MLRIEQPATSALRLLPEMARFLADVKASKVHTWMRRSKPTVLDANVSENFLLPLKHNWKWSGAGAWARGSCATPPPALFGFTSTSLAGRLFGSWPTNQKRWCFITRAAKLRNPALLRCGSTVAGNLAQPASATLS